MKAAAALLLMALTLVNQSVFDARVSSLLSRLSTLEAKHVDVHHLVEELDKAVKLYQRGRVEEALRLLDEVEANVTRLEGVAGSVYTRYLIGKVVTVAFLASIPLLTYILLPRAYLRLWYRLRRDWVVVEAGKHASRR